MRSVPDGVDLPRLTGYPVRCRSRRGAVPSDGCLSPESCDGRYTVERSDTTTPADQHREPAVDHQARMPKRRPLREPSQKGATRYRRQAKLSLLDVVQQDLR